MASTTRTTVGKTTTTVTNLPVQPIPADAYRAFADFLSSNPPADAVGADGNFTDWYAGDGGKAAIQAFADQAEAAARGARMADFKACWRDCRTNGKITMYGKANAQRALTYLQSVDFDAIVATPAEATPIGDADPS